MKNIGRVLVFLFIPAMIIQACGDARKAKNYNEKTLVDQGGLMFINKASEAGLTEVKASMVAQEVSKNQRVIEFAGMMIADHTTAGSELNKLAKDELVNTTDTISRAHQQTIDSLSKLTGTAFDNAYMAMMVKDHADAVKLFTDASSNKNTHIQGFARKTLPTLKMHYDSATVINGSLK